MAGQDWQPRSSHPTDPIFPQPMRSLYSGGEFGYITLVANMKKLTLSYVGNHDGEVHDAVEIMASGQFFNGFVNADAVASRGRLQSTFSLYVKIGSLLVLGAFIGYVLGFGSRFRKNDTWTPVKIEET